MTCREKLAIEHPESISLEYKGGCSGCPSNYGYMGDPSNCGEWTCTNCWDREIPGTGTADVVVRCDVDRVSTATDEKTPSKLVAQITPKIDISKLIDEAMEKKDRYVTVFVNNEGHMSINVYPYEKDEPRWIPVTFSDCDVVRGYKCSECGYEDRHPDHPYCPMCGEKLKQPE